MGLKGVPIEVVRDSKEYQAVLERLKGSAVPLRRAEASVLDW